MAKAIQNNAQITTTLRSWLLNKVMQGFSPERKNMFRAVEICDPGQQKVWYSDSENFGIRILTRPAEDYFYGMLLVMMDVALMQFVKLKSVNHNVNY